MDITETEQTLYNRRSIRKYTGEKVSETLIERILMAGMAAPSAVHKDPWRFKVIYQEEIDACIPYLANGEVLRLAGQGILICGDLLATHDEQESYMIQDCSAAIQNMLNVITALGLGGLWMGVHPRANRVAGFQKLYHLPDYVIPIAVIAFGYGDEEKEPETRFDVSKLL